MVRVLVCAVAVLLASPAEAAPSAVGTWSATIDGSRVQVVLEASGRGTLDGESLVWRQSGATVTVQTQDGGVYTGTLDDHTLRVDVDGQLVMFARALERAATSTPTLARPVFKPSRLLAGKRVTPEGTSLSFVVPAGWTSGWQTRDGSEVYVIARGKDLAILGSARALGGDEAALAPSALLARWMPASGLRVIEAVREFTVNGQPGAIVVHESSDQEKVRTAAAVVIVDAAAVVLVAVSPRAKATSARQALDTVLATLEGRVTVQPAAAPALAAGVVGCWTSYENFGGKGSSTRKVIIAQDGSYRWTGTTSFGATGSSRTSEVGSWTLSGATLTMVPDGGKRAAFSVRLDGTRTLVLGSIKLTRCGS